jgi:hypothetical protein
LYVACKSASMNVAVPDKFAANATQMKVSGLNHFPKPRLAFGNYRTTKVKTGWGVSSRNKNPYSGLTKEETLLKFFNIIDNTTQDTRNKYRYTIQDGDLVAKVYCLEKTTKQVLSANTRLGEFSKTKNFQYSFSATILPQTMKGEQWQLVFHNSYDHRKDTAHKFFDRPYVDYEGYATNGKIQIDIRPIITDRVVLKDSTASKTFSKLLMAYELKIDGGVIGVIDVYNNNVWIYNDLDKDLKLVIASVSSAILMRKLNEGKV